MKPSRFTYHRPSSVDEALSTLAECGQVGKVLAGGQSLVPILNMRLAAPKHLVDVNRLHDLATVRVDSDAVVIGALARHAQVAADDPAYAAQPLLRRALRLVAHPAIRNRGTTVGSIVHADPAAEMPAVLVLTGGTMTVASTSGTREVAAADFFLGAMESDVSYGELAVSATFPVLPPGTGGAVLEISRRHGDYALAGVALTLTVSEDQVVTSGRAAYFAVDAAPVLVEIPELLGRSLDTLTTAVCEAAGRDTAAGLRPDGDIHATGAYRKHLAAVLTGRAIATAAADLAEQAVRGAA